MIEKQTEKFNSFHNEQAERMRRQVMDGVKQTQNYINYTLRGQFQNQPRAHPTGSFNTMSQHSFNTANLSQMKQTEDLAGGAQTVEGHNLIMNQLKNRALQLEQLSAGLPQQQQRPQQAAEIPDTVSTSLELFFSSLTSSDFSLSYISSMNKEAKQALGNLKQYGLDLDKQTLERYAQITETHLDNYLTNIDELYLGRDIFGSYLENRDGKQERKRGDLYLDYLERIDYYEVIFKIYLTLQALINSFGTSPDTRKQAFNEQFKNIIMAPKNKIFNPELKRIDDILKRGYKSLKDVINKSAYDEIKEYFETTKEKKKNPSLKDRGEERGLKDFEDMREEEREAEREENKRKRAIEKLLKSFEKQNKILKKQFDSWENKGKELPETSKPKRERLLKKLREITNNLQKLGAEAPPIAKPTPPTGEAKEAPKQAADGGMPEFKPPPAAIEEDSEDDLPEAPLPPRTKRAQTPATPAPAVPPSPASPLDATIQRLEDDLRRKEKRLLDHIVEYKEDDGAITNKKARNHRKDLRKQYNKAKADYEAQIRGRAKETPTKPPSGAAAPYDDTDGTGEEDLTGQGMNPAKFTTNFLKGSGPMFKQIEQIFKGKRRLWK